MSYRRHKFWNFELIARKAFVFVGILSVFFLVFLSLTYLFDSFIRPRIYLHSYVSIFLAMTVGVFLYHPFEKIFTALTDRFFFHRKYNYQKILKDASKGISKIESLKHLFSLVVHFVTMKIRVGNAAILTRQNGRDHFKLGYERGYRKMFIEYTVQASNPLIQFLETEREAIDLEQVNACMNSGKKERGKKPQRYDFAAIKRQMDDLEIVCCVPSFLGRELRNVLVLGEKKSGHRYTDEDLNVLFTLAQESAIAIENARLYDEAIKKTRELEQINHQLEVAKLRLTKSLQETEKSSKQLQDAQVQLVHEQKMATLGRLAASVGHEVNNPLTILSMNVSRAILKNRKNPELKVAEIMDMFQKMEQNINRIKAVVNTLTGLLKKSEKGKFEPLSLKLILEETLPLVQFQTYLDNLNLTDVEFNVPGNIALIRGDLERLQEVFLNLFINAYHAIADKRNPRIAVKAEVNPDNPKMISIQFKDNGHGMSDEVTKKIFNYGYTTKPPGRGSGLGLYMCKYIIELHGGTIQVSSQVGRGTTFLLTLPIYEETTVAGSGQQATAS